MLSPYDKLDRVLEFRPRYSQGQTQRLVKSISQNPHLYTENTLSSIKDHAAHFKIPFEVPEKVSIDPKENEFQLLRGLGEVGEGFLSGFSTFEVGEPSENEYERILRSVGHLAGFVGYVPGMPFTAAGKLIAAASKGSKGLNAAERVSNLAQMAKALKGRSVPMAIATQAQKAARGIVKPTLTKAAAGRAGVTKTVSDFLLKDTPSHLAEGAFHLGIASAVGSWQHGVDEMLKGGAHGALTGAVFRGIGNVFKSGGVPKIDKRTGKKILTVDQKTDRSMRMLSSSLYEGLQSSYRGETTPEQVYSYLLGAFFGAHESSAVEGKKNKFMGKMERLRRKDPKSMLEMDPETKLPVDWGKTVYNARLIPGYEKLSPDVQKAVVEEARTRYGTWAENPTIAALAMKEAGIFIEDLGPKEIEKVREIVREVAEGNTEMSKNEEASYINDRERAEILKLLPHKQDIVDRYNSKRPEERHITDKEFYTILHTGKATGELKEITSDPQFTKLRDFISGESESLEFRTLDPEEGEIVIPLRNPKTKEVQGVLEHYKAYFAPYFKELNESTDFIEGGAGKPATQYYGDKGTKKHKPKEWTDELIALKDMVEEFTGYRFNSAVVNRYKGKQRIGWHSDNEVELQRSDKKGPVVASVSFGAERDFLFRPIKGGKEEGITLGDGDILLMRGDTQKNYHHAIREFGGDRISVTFRRTGPGIRSEARNIEHPAEPSGPQGRKPKLNVDPETGQVNLFAADKNELPPEGRNDPQTGGTNNDVRVENRATQFVREFFKHRYDKVEGIPKQLMEYEDIQKLKTTILRYIKMEGYESELLAKEVGKEFDIDIKTAAKNSLRQMLRRYKDTVQPRMVSVRIAYGDGTGPPTIHADNLSRFRPVNHAGNSKSQQDVKKVFEHVFDRVVEEFGDRVKVPLDNKGNPHPPWLQIDHFNHVPKGQKFPTEGDLSKIGEHAPGDWKYQLLRNSTLKDYYYFGGKNDSGKMFFMLPHPEKSIPFEKILDAFGKNSEGKFERLADAFIEDILGTEKPTNKERSWAMSYFIKAFESNVLWAVEMNGLRNYGKGDYIDGLKFLLKHSRIASPKDFNKRSQIWMTDGHTADPLFFKNAIGKWSKEKGLSAEDFDAIQDGKIRYMLYEDAEGRGVKRGAKSSEMTESTDGGIDVADWLFDIINNDFGMPESGQQKSFIVDRNARGDNPNGSLLGKFMFHRASEMQSEWMKKNKIGFLIPRSSAKDSGDRSFVKLLVKNGEVTTNKAADIYTLDVDSIKGLMSEANTKHMTEDQSTPKQIMTNLTHWARAKIPQETIDKMFDDWTRTKYDGEKEWNDKVDEYLVKDPKDVSSGELEDLIRNMDKVGLPNLLNAIQNTKHHDLVGQLYKRILKVNADNMADLKNEGEITEEEYQQSLGQVREFNSSIDRMFRLKPHAAIFMYKDARGYVQNAMRNFAVHMVTRPKQSNSISARMRPYNIFTKLEYPDLDGNSRAFMLDDLFRDRRIDLTGIATGEKGKLNNITTLGKLWDEVGKDLDNHPKLKEFLNAIVVRVPMDSISGAHELEFKGFTGIKGHGVVLHGKAMKALGGADLDGDKAFTFFGWDKEIRDAYSSNKGEFETANGEMKSAKNQNVSPEGLKILNENWSVDDVKEFLGPRKKKNEDVFKEGMSLQQLLTTTPTDGKERLSESPLAMYSPHMRMIMAENASAGRHQLGPAVVSRATLQATHAAMKTAMEKNIVQRYVSKKNPNHWISIEEYNKLSDKQAEKFEGDSREGIKVNYKYEGKWRNDTVFITPREDLSFARDLMRAEIGFASDPMNETGLRGRQNYFNWAYRSFFEIDLSNIPKPVRGYITPDGNLRGGLFQRMYNFNNAYFGKNFNLGRRHYLSEVATMAEPVRWMDPRIKNTFLPKMADVLEPLTLGDDIISRYDFNKINQNYDKHEKVAASLREYAVELGRLGEGETSQLRTGFAVPYTEPLKSMAKAVLRDKLFYVHERSKMGKDEAMFENRFSELIGRGMKTAKKEYEQLKHFPSLRPRLIAKREKMLKDANLKQRDIDANITRLFQEAEMNRHIYLEELLTKTSDFIQNDQMDFTSAKMLHKYIKAYEAVGVEPGFLEDASKFAERIKQVDRNLRRSLMNQEFEVSVRERGMKDSLKTKVEREIDLKSKRNVGETLEDIDELIHRYKSENATFKRELTPEEKDLTDALILSTFYRGKSEWLDKADRLEALAKEDNTGIILGLAKQVRNDASGTFFSKVGVNTKYVSDKVLGDFLDTYTKEFEYGDSYGSERGRRDRLVEEMEQDVPVDTDPKNQRQYVPDIFENETEGFRNVKKMTELDEGARHIHTEFADHLRHYQNSIGKELNTLMRGMIGKNLNAMDLEDYRVVNRQFSDMRTGNWFLKNFGKMAEGMPVLSKRHWMMFPRAVSEEHIIKDFIAAREEGFFRNYEGEMARGPIARPTHYIERTQYMIGQMQALAIKKNEEELGAIQKYLHEMTGYDTIKEGHEIHNVAFTEREATIANKLEHRANDGVHPFLKKERAKEYKKRIDEAREKADWDNIKDKIFHVKVGDESLDITGSQMKDRIKDAYTELAKKNFRWIRGSNFYWHEGMQDYVPKESEDPFNHPVDPEGKPVESFYLKDQRGNILTWEGSDVRKIDTKRFVNHLMEYIKQGKSVPMDYGLDGIRIVSKNLMLENKMLTPEYRDILMRQTVKPTNFYHPSEYNPHINIDRSKAKKSFQRALTSIENSATLSDTVKKEQIRRLILDYRRTTGDYLIQDVVDWNMYSDALTDIAEGRSASESDVMNWTKQNAMAGSMHKRQSHIAGWDSDPGAWEAYQKNLVDTYYRQLGQVLARSMFNEFATNYGEGGLREMPKDLFNSWGKFYSDYIAGSLGYPSEVPKEWTEGPESSLMNVKGTPYAWWADNNVRDRLNSIKQKLGFKKSEKLPEELQGISVEDLRHWSNLEAKFEMAALLAHPKSAMGNLYGGTMHTYQSVGWRNLRNAGDLDYINKMVPGANFKTKKDLERWAVDHGVVPEYIIYEAGINPSFKGAKWKAFMEDAVKILQKDPMVSDTTLKEVALKHKINESIYDKAAWFMREPERLLRTKAFVSHYLQAREIYGHANMDINHPFLINMAKRGVQATQFLYSAPYRPAFSRTALGKVMTRFQTWAWNAVRFRREITKEARQYGYREGTAEFDRFKRLMTTDMFVFSLANVFAYSLFEAALPAPWSWLQDTSDWIFGDEGERDRAFFGQWPTSLAPLQMVTPPIARLPVASLRAFTDDDYSRLSGYYIWTMFPFGRIARDVKGVIENPMMAVEKMTGIPYMKFAREVQKRRKEVKGEEPESDTGE